MKINDAMNIVIPVGDGLQAFSTPISDAVYEANYRVLAEAQAQIFGDGLKKALLTGPRVAALAVKDCGMRLADDDGDSGAAALLSEIKRLTVILAPSPAGWDMIPIDAAISSGALDMQDWKEAEGQLVFFTCAFYMEGRKGRKKLLTWMAETLSSENWKLCITSQNCGEYADSLQTAKQDAISSAVEASSVPV